MAFTRELAEFPVKRVELLGVLRAVAQPLGPRRIVPEAVPAPEGCCGEHLVLVTEFWEAQDRRFYCFCGGCGWTGEITPYVDGRVVGHEPEH